MLPLKFLQLDAQHRRLLSYAVVASVLAVVSDGWSGKPSPLLHQILLLPGAIALALSLSWLLRTDQPESFNLQERGSQTAKCLLFFLAGFEVLSLAMIAAEGRHFALLGYHLTRGTILVLGLVVLVCWLPVLWRLNALTALGAITGSYLAGMAVAIRCFPLNYLRSDMLPVIDWADARWVHHLDPYTTMHVGTRLYDFPYLPGMIVAYAPFEAVHLDLRIATTTYLLAAGALIFFAAKSKFRMSTAFALGVFVLCPFLQYRHDLYLQPHWFALTAAIVLMQARRYLWAAFVWGCGIAVYQLSWVVFPFALLFAYRRHGWREALKVAGIAACGALAVVAPFIGSASRRIATNTVGQWSDLPHALADPINLSYWLTYLIRPDHLKWVQLAVLTILFGYCFFAGHCKTLPDTLRWMCVALAVFIPLNVLVDGYFYLTLLLMLLLYLCAVNDWWSHPERAGHPSPLIEGAGTLR